MQVGVGWSQSINWGWSAQRGALHTSLEGKAGVERRSSATAAREPAGKTSSDGRARRGEKTGNRRLSVVSQSSPPPADSSSSSMSTFFFGVPSSTAGASASMGTPAEAGQLQAGCQSPPPPGTAALRQSVQLSRASRSRPPPASGAPRAHLPRGLQGRAPPRAAGSS